jgi:hypothetical protein
MVGTLRYFNRADAVPGPPQLLGSLTDYGYDLISRISVQPFQILAGPGDEQTNQCRRRSGTCQGANSREDWCCRDS